MSLTEDMYQDYTGTPGRYGNIFRCDVSKAVHGTSQVQCFAWMVGLGRLFANLTEWGQQFMATPRPLEMLGGFLLVFTPNKKQFPLFKRHIFFCFGRLVDFSF